MRELPPLPSSDMLPALPIRIKSAIASGNVNIHFIEHKTNLLFYVGLLSSVIQEVVNALAKHLIKFNVSSKTHYYQIRCAFVKEYSMNEFKDNQELVNIFIVLFVRTLSSCFFIGHSYSKTISSNTRHEKSNKKKWV